jgi:hypothetical protein
MGRTAGRRLGSSDDPSNVATRGARHHPLVPVSLLAWFNAINPMSRTFCDAFDVVNDTDETIHVIPIGSAHRGRTPLPQLCTGRLVLPVWRPVRGVSPHSSVTIHYDADDTRASDLVIEVPSQHPRWLLLAPDGNDSSHEPPSNPRWVIHSLSDLPSAPAELLDLRRETKRSVLRSLGIRFGFLPTVLLLFAVRRMERSPKPQIA